MSVTNTIEQFASALTTPSQVQRFVGLYGIPRVLTAVVTKRTKLSLGKDHIECFGLRLPYELLYKETLLALRAVMLRVDERGLFTSVNAAAVKLNHFTHDALLERSLDRVTMALNITTDASLLATVRAVDPFLKVVYCRYCATCLRGAAC